MAQCYRYNSTDNEQHYELIDTVAEEAYDKRCYHFLAFGLIIQGPSQPSEKHCDRKRNNYHHQEA